MGVFYYDIKHINFKKGTIYMYILNIHNLAKTDACEFIVRTKLSKKRILKKNCPSFFSNKVLVKILPFLKVKKKQDPCKFQVFQIFLDKYTVL